ncbi:MAG: carboxypeptidase-like regulatory domain-containing protein [Acidobacteriota bacterium]|nr:carboxypeptidase-like regulatory domain-containing protein [Acidobacteriota bacterium]
MNKQFPLLNLILIVALFFCLAFACGDDNGKRPSTAPEDQDEQTANPPTETTDPELAALKPMPNFVTGRCVNMAGKPLANIQIFIKGVTMAGGQNTETFTKTKADGSFSIRVPAGLYSVYANLTIDAYDQTFKFQLEALDGKSDMQDSSGGVVEDFVWKIRGLRPDQKAKATSEREWNYSYYGARIYPDTRRSLGQYTNIEDETSLSKNYPADSQLEITLKPEGVLIDGSTGTVIVERLRLGDVGLWTFGIRDIPIGIYTAAASVITPDGEKIPVRCKVEQEGRNIDAVPWSSSAHVVFPAGSTEYGQSMTLYLAKP